MNNIDKIAQALLINSPIQLRTYIYVEWLCWLCTTASFLTLAFISWRKRDTWVIDHDIPVGWILFWVCAIIGGILLLSLLPFSLHVFTTPELEAVKILLNQ